LREQSIPGLGPAKLMATFYFIRLETHPPQTGRLSPPTYIPLLIQVPSPHSLGFLFVSTYHLKDYGRYVRNLLQQGSHCRLLLILQIAQPISDRLQIRRPCSLPHSVRHVVINPGFCNCIRLRSMGFCHRAIFMQPQCKLSLNRQIQASCSM
jgi:hypothetical protein